MRPFLNLCCVTALAALASATLTSASAASVTLRAGQTGTLGERTLTVVRVQDSRCPPGKQCIWAGEIVAKVLVRSGSRVSFLTLKRPAGPEAVPGSLRLSEASFDRVPRLTFTDESAGS